MKVFTFAHPVRLVKSGDFKADSIPSLIKGLSRASEEALFYHLYHHYWESQDAPQGGYNDFALWTSEGLGEKVLAEKLAQVQLAGIMQLEPTRQKLINQCEEYLGGISKAARVTEGQELYFQEITTVTIPTGAVASDLPQLVEAWKAADPASVFLHLVEARLKPMAGIQELTDWLLANGEEGLAQEVAQVSMYPYPLRVMHAYVAALLERRLAGHDFSKSGGLCPLSGSSNG